MSVADLDQEWAELATADIFKKLVPMAISYVGSGGSLIASSVAQLITFAILARSLGADQFASYVTIIAFAAVAQQICGLGSQETLVRRVAQDLREFPRMFGHSLLLTLWTGVALTVIGIIVLPIVTPVSTDVVENVVTMTLMVLSTVLLARFISLVNAAYIAHSNFIVANTLDVMFSLLRLLAAFSGCMLFGVHTAAGWAGWLFAAHCVAALISGAIVLRLGRPRFEIVREEIKIGALFSTQFIIKALRGNIEIVLLGLLTSSEVVSSYGLARRVLDSSYLALEALNRLIYPGSAVAMMSGFHLAFGRVRKVAIASIGIAVLAAVAVFVLAPLMPLLFGDEYHSVVGFTRILCWLVIPIAIGAVALEAFGAAGRQDLRAIIVNTASVAALVLIAGSTFIAGVDGAFASAYLVETVIAVAAWLILWRLVDADRNRDARAVPAQ